MTTDANPGNSPAHWEELQTMWKERGIDTIRSGEMAAAWAILASRFPVNGRFLEVGCGQGMFIEYLKSAGKQMEWHGLDLSEVACGTARDRIPEGTFTRLDVSCQAFPYDDGHFDVVFSGHTIEHLTNPVANMLPEMARVAKPDGMIVVEFPVEDLPYPEHIHDNLTYDKVIPWLEKSGIVAVECLPVLEMQPTKDGVIIGRKA